MSYVQSGYAKPGYYQTTIVVGVTVQAFATPAPGTFVAAGPAPGLVTVTSIAVPTPTTQLPGGPYSPVTALVLRTHAGNRIISAVAVDPVYGVPPALGRYVVLLELSSLTLSQGASGSTLVTMVNSLELPRFSFMVSNEDGFFSRLVATEYVLCMTVSVYLDLGGGENVFGGRGEIQEIQLRRKTARFEVGA